MEVFFMSEKEIENDKQQALDKEEKENEQIREMGELTLDQNVKRHRIELLTIIGEVEGHDAAPSQSKTTKYEHVLPKLAMIEDDENVEGLLILLNTVGGDVEAGLAIAEMIASLSIPTVSLVLGGGHSIGVPMAVSADYSFAVPSATMVIHPVRSSGMFIGVAQTYRNMEKIQDRITGFIAAHSRASQERLEELMLDTSQLVKDVGTLLEGEKAVKEGLIDEIGGIRVVLDGVFNHVGRGFWAFEDVLKNREQSPYVNWFGRIAFDGNSNYNDGLWYEGWEGNYDLVKLNLRNEEVIQHIFSAIKGWVDEFDIDGLRLDVAYCLDHDFVRRLRSFCNELKPDFFLVGETLHGDYNQLMNDEMLHSVTNYECYKGLYSSFNCMNMFEINHSLLRQFGSENWTLYKGKHLLSFVDNHDVTRVASILTNKNHLPLIYALAFGMPGIPCVYYGSEWGAEGRKEDGDPALRPAFEKPEWNDLTEWISKLAEAKKQSKALQYGNFISKVLTNGQCVFEREWEGERVYVAVNAADSPFYAGFDAGAAEATDLITGEKIALNGGFEIPGYRAFFLRV